MNSEPQPVRVQAALSLYHLMIPSMLYTNISVMTLYGVRSVQHTESYSAATSYMCIMLKYNHKC